MPDQFYDRLETLPTGYTIGQYNGASYGVTVQRAASGKRLKLFAEALGGNDYISFNLYFLASGERRLKPCEMPAAKVIAFVTGFQPNSS